jgi:type IV pilus assembly protein PilC
MALYAYRAMNLQGRIVTGSLDAMNPVDLEMRLKRLGFDLVTHGFANRPSLFRKRRINRPELINFCFHLEQLMRAGVPIIEALSDLRDSVTTPNFRETLANLVESIEGGMRLSDAMAQHVETFDTVFVSLIRAGEQSGQLPAVLAKLTENLRWQDELAAQTKKLMLYPAFVGTVMFVAFAFLMTKIVPDLIAVVKTMQPQLPLQTRVLLVVSDVFKNYWYLVIGVPIAFFFAFRAIVRASPKAQLRIDRIKLQLPLVGPTLQKMILARFATFFAMMYASGISILDCLQAAEKMAGNRVIEDGLQQVGRGIAEGQGITQSFQTVGLFPPLVLRMLRVGESTGGLDVALENVAYFYNRDVKESISKLQALIEPALTLFLGSMLIWVIMSVLGPIWGLISNVKL